MHDNIEKIATSTPDLALERQNQLRELFPEAWSEGELDFSKLRTLLGDLSDESAERYRFGWAGKRESLQLLQTPSHAALRPAPDESIDFDVTQNLFIEGDNLEVLKLLYKPLFNRVKMIYIDPPYNTGNDFIYPDNFTDPLKNYLIQTEQKDANGDLQTSTPDVAGRVHSRWLSMLYPRLTLARSLLRDDGVIFVSIDDNEVHHLRLLMNEVFGEENFVANVVWQKRTSPDARLSLGPAHDYILAFSRNASESQLNLLPISDERRADFRNPDNDPKNDWASVDLTGQTGHATPSQFYEIITPAGVKYTPPTGRCWALAQKTFEDLRSEGRIWFGQDGSSRPRLKRYLSESNGVTAWTWWTNKEVGHNQEATQELNNLLGIAGSFDNPKPPRLIKRILQLATSPTDDDIILDFFAGSGTTAQAVLELNREDGGNRRFVLVQLPEPTDNAQFPTIADIGKERIRRVIGRMKEQPLLDTRETPEDLGFKVWKLGDSHFRQFQPTEQGDVAAYIEQLELMNDALLPDYEPRAVLYEVALREGYGLNCSLEPVPDLQGVSVWRVSDADRGQHFFATLDDSLELESLRPLKMTPDDLFICRGIALDDDTAANLALQCRLKMI